MSAIELILTMGAMAAQTWPMPPQQRSSIPGGYYARRSPKKRAIWRARNGRK